VGGNQGPFRTKTQKEYRGNITILKILHALVNHVDIVKQKSFEGGRGHTENIHLTGTPVPGNNNTQ
jgi:hypothetical protein